MATLSAALAAVAARIAAITSPVTFRASTVTADELRAPGRSPVHLEYALAVPSSVPLARLDRQRPSSDMPCRHQLEVGLWWQHRSHDAAVAYREAIDGADAIRTALLAGGADLGGAKLAWTATARSPGEAGWLYQRLSFDLTLTDTI